MFRLIIITITSFILVAIGPAQAYADGQLPHWDDELQALLTIDPEGKRLVSHIRSLEAQLDAEALTSDVRKLIESVNINLPSSAYIAAILAVLPFRLVQIIKNWAAAILAYLNYLDVNGSFEWDSLYGLKYQLNDEARIRLRGLL